jgi:hypothetical protein
MGRLPRLGEPGTHGSVAQAGWKPERAKASVAAPRPNRSTSKDVVAGIEAVGPSQQGGEESRRDDGQLDE